MRPRPVDVAAWRTARDLADLGELTAEWLGGKLPYHPAYGGETPNEERTPLIPRLAGFNRAGYVTEDSQPGEPREDGWTQRACVFGYCNEAIAETLAAACMATDIICIVSWPGARGGPHIPVTIAGSRAHTWGGMPQGPEEIEHIWGGRCSDLDA